MKKTTGSSSASTALSLLLIVILVAFDQWTKHLAVVALKGKEALTLLQGVLELRYLENRGAAFSMLQNKQFLFYVLTAVFLVVAVYILRRIPRTKYYLPVRICLLFLVSGALGNLIDRLLQKYVVDFIYFSIIHFPVFNVADIYVTLSVVTLSLLVLFHYKDNDFAFLKRKPAEGEGDS